MGKINYVWFVVTLALMTKCGGDNTTDLATEAVNKLAGTWTINGGYIKADGTDVSAEYTGLAITFTGTKDVPVYLVQNGGYAFGNVSADTWSFTDNTFTAIKRGQDETVMYYTIADNTLTLTFTISDPLDESGRTQGMFGDFEVVLKKK